MPNRTRLRRAIDTLVAEIRAGFEPAPETISPEIPQRRLTDWRWSPRHQHIAGLAGWAVVTGEILRVDPGQSWAVCVDGFVWLERHDHRREVEALRELPRPDVDVGPVAGRTADLSDAEFEALFAAKTPPQHDDDEN